jgi:YD repeat-containing protein
MVAVLSGNGLGLNNTSLTQLGQAFGGAASQGQGRVGQYVNVATGNLVLQSQDDTLAFDGLSVPLLRTYNSQGQLNGTPDWLFGLSRSLQVPGGGAHSKKGGFTPSHGDVWRTGDDGSRTRYSYDFTQGLYTSQLQDGTQDTLQWDGTNQHWIWTDGATRRQEIYTANGRLVALTNPETGARDDLSYDTYGRLTAITAADGDHLSFNYDAATGLLAGIALTEVPPGQNQPVTRQQVSYAYDAQGRLTQVATTLASDTDPTVTTHYATSYTYDAAGNLASMRQSDGTTVSYTWQPDGLGAYRLASVTSGSGAAAQTLTFGYDLFNGDTTVTDGLGNRWTYRFDSQGRLTQIDAPAVDGTVPSTTFQYDHDGNLTQKTDADGGSTYYRYDGQGNLAYVQDPTGHAVAYIYNGDDQLTSATRYTVPAQGDPNQWWSYTPPSGAETRYVAYDAGDRVAYSVDALGDVTRYSYTTTSAGLTVLASTRQYLGARFDTSAFSTGLPPQQSDLDAWVASAAVQGTLAQGTRTDYQYDLRGQLSQETQYATIDARGNGVLDAGAAVIAYTYDAQGQLLQRATVRGANRGTPEVIRYAYDGLGRLVGTTDPLGNATTTAYDDAGQTVTLTQANGLAVSQAWNSAGLLLSRSESAGGSSRTTQYLYDADGRSVAAIDATGQASYTFYDADGRVAGTVDAMGAVTAYTYDAAGRQLGATAYATTIDTSAWLANGTLTSSFPTSLPLPAASAADRSTHTLYDAAGRVVATLDPQGVVSTTDYDGAGNAVRQTTYAAALNDSQIAGLGQPPSLAALQTLLTQIAQPGADRVTRNTYDADQRVVQTIDPAGVVTTLGYDDVGRVIERRTGDQVERHYYDARGQEVASVDADGYLSTTAYDETSHTDTTTRYAQALSAVQLAALTGSETGAQLVALLGSNTARQQGSVQYDADGRVLARAAVDGTVTSYRYDSVGQLLSITVTPVAGQGATRTTAASFDAFGDETSVTDAAGATTRMTYDALGRETSRTDALGNTAWSYYDADGRLTYRVTGQVDGVLRNARGSLVAFHYDAFGRLLGRASYAGLLTLTPTVPSQGATLNPLTAGLPDLANAAAAIANPAADAHVSYSYTRDGQVASTTDGLGYQTVYGYDAFGDETSVQRQLSQPGSALGAGNSTLIQYGYDVRGERISETDAAGTALARSTQTSYDAYGRVTRTTDALGHAVSYAYDALGRQVSVSQMVDGAARSTQTTYDAYDRVLTQTDALGNVTRYQYDLAAHTTIVTTPDGVAMTTVKDAYGDAVSVTDGAGNTSRYAYDADGRLQLATDALGNVSTQQYDADGHRIQSTDASGHVVAYRYDANGRVLSRTVDPNGLALVTTYGYDGEGRTLSVTDPAGAVTTYAYDADGNVLTQVQDAGRLNLTTTYSYDGAGKTLTVTQGAGTIAARTTQYVYDGLERLSQQIVDPTGLALATTYTYDANDRLVAVTDPNGAVSRSVYDEAGEAVYAIAANGAVTQTSYDADGRVTATHAYATALTAGQLAGLGNAPGMAQVAALLVAGPDDAVRYSVYDAAGKLRYGIDPMGYVSETRYDAAGRVSETLTYAQAIAPDATATTAILQGQAGAAGTVAGLLAAAGNRDANARASLSLYDADGRLRFVVRQTANGSQALVGETRYDGAGRVVAQLAYGQTLALNPGQSLSQQLTTDDVAQALAGAPAHLSGTVYDQAGRSRYQMDAAGYVTETGYDADGRAVSQTAYANPIALPASLDEASLATALAAAGTRGARTVTTTYDTAGRILATGDALGTNASYTYDATGLKLSFTNRDGATWTYAYDTAGRKVLEQSPAVTVASYDGSGNVLDTGASLFTAYRYDHDGNVVAISRGSGAHASSVAWLSTTAYAYDVVGHQIRTTYPNGATTQVVYDALGRAVADRDADGHWQYKVYDRDGQQAYGIDANGYVTATTHDAYGEGTAVIRYAQGLAAVPGWSAGQPLTLEQVQQALQPSAADRRIDIGFDQVGRKVEVQQTAMAYAYSVGAQAGQAATGRPTTTYAYDAYGNQVGQSVLVQGTPGTDAVWATTLSYYDARGQQVMTVDPMGYVTTVQYDGFGEQTVRTEYAQALATAGLSAATPPAPPAADLSDRVTDTQYDALGRKTAETFTGAVSWANGVAGEQRASSTTSYAYDGEGRLASQNVNGQLTTTQYDALGQVVAVTGPARQVLVDNWQTLLQQNAALHLGDPSLYATVSPVTRTEYDALGNALRTTTSAGSLSRSSTARYDAVGHQVALTDANGVQHASSYDNNGNLLGTRYTLTGNNGAQTEVTTASTYDAVGQRLATVTTRGGNTDSASVVQYDAFGEVVAKGDGVHGWPVHFAYDAAGNLVGGNDAKTSAWHSYSYDLAGHQVGDSWQVTGGQGSAGHYATLDLDGRHLGEAQPSTSAVSGEGSSTSHTYDRWGNMLTSTDALGNLTTYVYDSRNQLIREIEPRVLVVDEQGLRSWQTPEQQAYYDVNGWLRGATDENGHTTTADYDAVGEAIRQTDATGAVTTTAYDALGRAVAVETPPVNAGAGPARIRWTAYNALDQVTAQGDLLVDGSVRDLNTQQAYQLNSNGDRIAVTDAMGKTAYYDYDSQHRVIRSQSAVQAANGWAETSSYDVNGNKIASTNANGDSQSWNYDYFGRVLAHTDLSGAQYGYTYDNASGLLVGDTSTWSATAQGQVDPRYFDTAGRTDPTTGTPLGTGWVSAATATQYTYLADGQLATITRNNGTESFQYDADGRVTFDKTVAEDATGGSIGTATLTDYDSHGHLLSVGTAAASAATTRDNATLATRTLYDYDAAGNRRAVFSASTYGQAGATLGQGGPAAIAPIVQTVDEGNRWSFDAGQSFTDPLGFGLTYQISPADGQRPPAWLRYDSNGFFSGSPNTSGSWTFTITATDVLGQTATTTLTLTVQQVVPVFASASANQLQAAGQAFSFTEPAATDPEGASIAYGATLADGTALPSWLGFSSANGTLTFTGTPPADAVGHAFQVQVTATTVDGRSSIETFSLGVVTSTLPVYGGGLANRTGLIGGPQQSWPLPAGTFSDPNGLGLTYSAQVLIPGHVYEQRIHTASGFDVNDVQVPDQWVGIGSIGLGIDAASGTLSGVPTTLDYSLGDVFTWDGYGLYADDTTYQVRIVATNTLGNAVSGTFTLANTIVPPAMAADSTVNAVAGQSFATPVKPTIYDSNASSYPLSMWNGTAWAQAPSWAGFDPTTMQFTGLASSPGSYFFKLGNSTSTATQSFEVVVASVAGASAVPQFTSEPSNALATEGQAWSVGVPSATDAAQQPVTYTASLAGGGPLPSWLSFNAGSLTFAGTPPAGSAGSYNLSVTATTVGGAASESFTLTVATAAASGGSITPPPAAISQVVSVATGASFMLSYSTLTFDAIGANWASMWNGTTWVQMPSWATFDPPLLSIGGTAPGSSGTYYFQVSNGTSNQVMQLTVGAPAATLNTAAKMAPMMPVGGWPPEPPDADVAYTESQYSPFQQALPGNGGYQTLQMWSGFRWTSAPSWLSVSGSTMSGDAPFPGDYLLQASGPNGAVVVDLTVQSGQRPLAPGHQAEWFTYDAANRTVVNNGQLINNQIRVTTEAGSFTNRYDGAGNAIGRVTLGSNGHVYDQAFGYDARNQETTARYKVDLSAGQADQGVQDSFAYDADGRQLTDTGYLSLSQAANADGTRLHTQQQMSYDDDGHLLQQVDASYHSAYAVSTQLVPIGGDGGGGTGGTSGGPVAGWQTRSQTAYTGYDHQGNVTAYAFNQLGIDGDSAFNASYTVSYLKKDGYLESATSATTTTAYYQPATDTSSYDNYGDRVRVQQMQTHADGSGYAVQRVFQTDLQGQILARLDGSIDVERTVDWGDVGYSAYQTRYRAWSSTQSFAPDGGAGTHHYAYAQGQLIGDFDESGQINVKDQLTAFSSGATGSYTVQAGDTLQSIAQNVYGSSDLWYVIADANGLQGDSGLSAGQSLTIPQVTTHQNSASTFKPYDPGKMVGSTTPSLPFVPPPPSSSGCSGLAQVVMIAVTLVVAYYTGIYLQELGYGAAVTGAGAAATGSVAGQLAGDAMGIHHGISLGEVAVAAAGGAIGGGLSSQFSTSSSAFYDAASANGISESGNALIGAASYAGSDEAAKITGQATHFSWAGLVASATGSAAAGKLGPTQAQVNAGDQNGEFWSRIEANAVQDIVTRETSVALSDDHVPSWQQVGEDIFGNALGSTAVDGINAYKAANARQVAAFGRAAGSLRAQDQSAFQTYFEGQAQGLGDLAFDQRAEAIMASSQLLASTDAYSTYTGVYGLPEQGDHTRQISDADLKQSQADIDRMRAQGVDTTRAQQALDELWTRTYVGGASQGSDGLNAASLDISLTTPDLVPSTMSAITLQSSTPAGADITALAAVSVKASSDARAEALWEDSLGQYAQQVGLPAVPADFSPEQYRGYYEVVQGFYNNHGDSGDYAAMKENLHSYVIDQEKFNIANDSVRWQAFQNYDSLQAIKAEGTLALNGAVAGLTAGIGNVAMETYAGTRTGSVLKYMLTARTGAALVGSGANLTAQAIRHPEKINPVEVVTSGATAYLGMGRGIGWNSALGFGAGVVNTEYANLMQGGNENVLVNAATSGATTGIGYGTGDWATKVLLEKNMGPFMPYVWGNVAGGLITEFGNYTVDESKNISNSKPEVQR